MPRHSGAAEVIKVGAVQGLSGCGEWEERWETFWPEDSAELQRDWCTEQSEGGARSLPWGFKPGVVINRRGSKDFRGTECEVENQHLKLNLRERNQKWMLLILFGRQILLSLEREESKNRTPQTLSVWFFVLFLLAPNKTKSCIPQIMHKSANKIVWLLSTLFVYLGDIIMKIMMKTRKHKRKILVGKQTLLTGDWGLGRIPWLK